MVSLIPISISSIINPKLQAKESTLVGYPAIARISSLIIFGSLFGLFGIVSLSVLFSSAIETSFLALIYVKQIKNSAN